MVLCEVFHVEEICGREMLLHLVELIGAHGVQVSAVELLLHLLRNKVLIQEQHAALKVV